MFVDQTDDNDNKPIYVPPDVREVIQDLDEKEFEEELNDEQREVMEDIWLKADEMGKKINVTYIFSYLLQG